MATLVDFVPARDGEEAGISVYMNPDHRYEIGVGRAGRATPGVRAPAHRAAPRGGHRLRRRSTATAPVVLQVEATPEEYAFSFGIAASRAARRPATAPLGKALARYLSSEVAGGFTGVYVGLYATGNGQPALGPGPLRLVRLRAAVTRSGRPKA